MKFTVMALSLILFASFSQAEIIISGASEADVNKLRRDLPDLFTEPTDLSKVDDVIRAFTQTGLYENVVAEHDGHGPYVVMVKALRTITQIQILGAKVFKERDLRPAIELNSGERFDRKKVIEAGERLKQFYGERGYFNTVIEVTFNKETNTSLNVVFQITEGAPCLMRGFTIEADNPDLVDRLARVTNHYLKKPLTTLAIESLAQDINEFLRERRYLRTEILGPEAKYNAQKTQAWLTYKLTEPYRYEFVIQGATSTSPTEIYRLLSASTLERGTADPAIEAVERIRQGFLRMGYANVDVTSKMIEISDTFVRRVRIEVVENQRVRINEISISGRISRPNSYYEKFIRNNSSPLIKRGFYNRQDLEKGYNNLITELRNQGYLRAKIQSSRLEYLERKDEARVVVIMDEGPLTQIRNVTFTGNVAFPSEVLQSVVSVKANSPLRLNQLEESLEQLKKFYKDRGFLEMRIMNEGEDLLQYNDRGTHAEVRFELFEGPKVVIHSISLEGNSFTKSEVILRTADLKVGEVLTPEKLDTAEERLNRLGIFKRSTIRTLEEGSNVSDRTLIITVVEDEPKSFRIGAGVNSERDLTIRGFTGLGNNNLYGTARAVSVRAELKSHVVQVNYPQYEVVGSYREPFLLNSKARGRVNLTRAERIFEINEEKKFTNITASNKVDLFIDRDFSKHVLFTWKAYSMDSRREFERYGRCIQLDPKNFDPNKYCNDNLQQIATVGPILDLDYRDNQFSPTRGHRTTFNLDYSDPVLGSSLGINFVRTELGHTRILQLGSARRLWANTIKSGYVANLSNRTNSGVPTSHAFFLGGFSTIRGFGGTDDNERLPAQYQLPVSTGNQLLIHTDSHYVLFRSELQFNITGAHGLALFYDGGMVKVSGYTFDRPYRDAVGFGYRYNTPVGALSLDVGFKINPNTDKDRKQDPWRIHFSVGTF